MAEFWLIILRFLSLKSPKVPILSFVVKGCFLPELDYGSDCLIDA